jgi:hypothetical protein
VLPRLPDGEVEQRCAVFSGRLQIGHTLCRRANRFRIVLHDTLSYSKQRRLLAKVISSRVQLGLQLPAVSLAFFHIQEESDEQPDNTAYRNEKHKRDRANHPFKYRSRFHSLAADGTQIAQRLQACGDRLCVCLKRPAETRAALQVEKILGVGFQAASGDRLSESAVTRSIGADQIVT